MRIRSYAPALLLPLLVLGVAWPPGARAEKPEVRVPVLYCTDLFHPHDDPDDHFDIACLYALDELDVRGIVLDQGDRQARAPGLIPVSQLNHLTGRNVPCATGLSSALASTKDTGAGQPAAHQAGVELMLRVLREAESPVTIITVGSLRDVAAAFNRAPDLFRKSVAGLFVFIGAVDTAKPGWNVSLDPHAFVRVMNSGLAIHWVPCFDGGLFKNTGRASYWRASHARLLQHASPGALRFFVYALSKKETPDAIAFLSQILTADDRKTVLAGTRHLWCAAVFPYVAGRSIVRRDGAWSSVRPDAVQEGEPTIEPFRFEPVALQVEADTSIVYEEPGPNPTLRRFQVVDRATYADMMTSVTAHLIGSLAAD